MSRSYGYYVASLPAPHHHPSHAEGKKEERGGFGDRVDSQKPMLPRCIVICSHNFAAIIDPEDQGLCRARDVDRREGSSTVHKAMRPRGIVINTHDLATIIDPVRDGLW